MDRQIDKLIAGLQSKFLGDQVKAIDQAFHDTTLNGEERTRFAQAAIDTLRNDEPDARFILVDKFRLIGPEIILPATRLYNTTDDEDLKFHLADHLCKWGVFVGLTRLLEEIHPTGEYCFVAAQTLSNAGFNECSDRIVGVLETYHNQGTHEIPNEQDDCLITLVNHLKRAGGTLPHHLFVRFTDVKTPPYIRKKVTELFGESLVSPGCCPEPASLSADQTRNTIPNRAHKLRSTKTIALLCFGLAWGAMIVASSSTVVFAHDFIHMMAKYVLPTDDSVTAFQIFWGSCWFAVVKGWHMTEFAVICLVLIAILHRVFPKLGQTNIGLALFATTLFAINDEYRQTFVEGRGGTWSDVGFDVFGASTVAWFCLSRKATVAWEAVIETDPAGPSTV